MKQEINGRQSTRFRIRNPIIRDAVTNPEQDHPKLKYGQLPRGTGGTDQVVTDTTSSHNVQRRTPDIRLSNISQQRDRTFH